MIQIIKKGVLLNRREFCLSLIVFVYLVFSFSVMSHYSNVVFLPYLQFVFFLLENYLTVSVYYGIRQSIGTEQFKLHDVFTGGNRFFGRVLWYKVLSLIFILVVAAFCLSMIELVKDAPLITTGLITAFTVIWLSFPVYLFLLTVYAPLIIVSDDVPLFTAIKTSMLFIRNNLGNVVKLLTIFLPLWCFAILLLKLYNGKGLVFQFCIFYIVSLLEIITVKVFLFFYRGER
ncbi:MAG: hypothetical protein PHI44_00690 [Candidatus Ratteibacteria bacterium]|nr:hypothetical protein [Candidatus Ratteibacteria bacterium]